MPHIEIVIEFLFHLAIVGIVLVTAAVINEVIERW